MVKRRGYTTKIIQLYRRSVLRIGPKKRHKLTNQASARQTLAWLKKRQERFLHVFGFGIATLQSMNI